VQFGTWLRASPLFRHPGFGGARTDRATPGSFSSDHGHAQGEGRGSQAKGPLGREVNRDDNNHFITADRSRADCRDVVVMPIPDESSIDVDKRDLDLARLQGANAGDAIMQEQIRRVLVAHLDTSPIMQGERGGAAKGVHVRVSSIIADSQMFSEPGGLGFDLLSKHEGDLGRFQGANAGDAIMHKHWPGSSGSVGYVSYHAGGTWWSSDRSPRGHFSCYR
jgi:hypothetical protein